MDLSDLKLQLFDSIADAKNSMDIMEIKKESDAIYDRLILISQQDGKFSPELFKSNIYVAISSYYYNSDFSLEDRLPIIDGMIFHANTYVKYESIMENIGVVEQIEFCLNLFNSYKNKIVLSDKEERNIGLGIAMSANLTNMSKEK